MSCAFHSFYKVRIGFLRLDNARAARLHLRTSSNSWKSVPNKHNFRRVFEKPINQDLEEQRRHGTAVALASFHRLPRPKCMRRWNARTKKAILSHITPQRPPTTACSRVLHKMVCTKTDDFFLHARLSFDSPGKSPMTSMTSMTRRLSRRHVSSTPNLHRCTDAMLQGILYVLCMWSCRVAELPALQRDFAWEISPLNRDANAQLGNPNTGGPTGNSNVFSGRTP